MFTHETCDGKVDFKPKHFIFLIKVNEYILYYDTQKFVICYHW